MNQPISETPSHASSSAPILTASHITKTYGAGERGLTVLNDITLSVSPGEFLVITGNSGSGKTTLLSLLSGLDQPDKGEIVLDGAPISRMSEPELAPLRNRVIGFVFQDFHLAPSLTALENVAFPAEVARRPDAGSAAMDLMKRTGVDGVAPAFPHQLSGGEKQRIAICRALINRPRVLFADEPTGNLDRDNSGAVMDLLLRLRRDTGATLIMVTHNPEIADMADRRVRLFRGRLLASGAPEPEISGPEAGESGPDDPEKAGTGRAS